MCTWAILYIAYTWPILVCQSRHTQKTKKSTFQMDSIYSYNSVVLATGSLGENLNTQSFLTSRIHRPLIYPESPLFVITFVRFPINRLLPDICHCSIKDAVPECLIDTHTRRVSHVDGDFIVRVVSLFSDKPCGCHSSCVYPSARKLVLTPSWSPAVFSLYVIVRITNLANFTTL